MSKSPRWIWNASRMGSNLVDPIFKGNGDIRNNSCYRAVKLLEHGMKVVKRVQKRPCRIVTVDEMQFGFMPEKGTTDVYFEKAAKRVSCQKKKAVFHGTRENF